MLKSVPSERIWVPRHGSATAKLGLLRPRCLADRDRLCAEPS